MGLDPGTKLGSYEIVAPLGAGGMGEVYRARDAKLDRDVAVKVLPRQLSEDRLALARFEREAKAVASTSHPNILAIFDFGSAAGVAYAVTEMLEGETLRARITEGALPVRKAVDYAAQIAEGLSAAHDHGIVHRDLKPENLFVTREGRVKILDFGLARQVVTTSSDDTQSPTLSPGTEPGTVMGTVGYMSPEQVRGLPADPRSDIFSFGAVLYEMVSGRRAFRGQSAAETMHAILKEDPSELAETGRVLPPALERIVSHCLEKRPEERFHSAHDLAFDLRALSTASGASTAVPAVGGAAGRGRRIAFVSALLGTGVAFGVLADRAIVLTRPVEPPTYRRVTFERGTVGRARFAPDGNTIVYSAAWRGQPDEVFTARLDSRESRSFGFRGAVFAVSSSSELAIGLGPQVAAWPTLSRVPLAGGAPREVLENVGWADWSPDGADLAVVHYVEGVARLEFPIGKVLYESRGNITHARVSPGGDRVAFIAHDDPTQFFGAGSVVTVDRKGATRTLSSGWVDLFGLAWRPDGMEVWFTGARRGETKALHAVTLAGEARLVTRLMGPVDLEDISRDGRVLVGHPSFRVEMAVRAPGESKERELTWLGLSQVADLSKDGSKVLFTVLPEGAAEGGATYLRGTDGSPPVRLGDGVAQALSPDGKWALATLSSPSRLIVLPTGPGQTKDLTRPGLTYLGAGWFPDSRRVAFTAEAQGARRTYAQDVDGGEPRAVGPDGVALVTPDGRSLVVVRDGKAFLHPIDGGEPRPIPRFEPGDWPVGWSRDGRSLFVQRFQDLTVQVHRLDTLTARRELLFGLVPPDPAGIAPFPGLAVSADGKSYAYSFIRNLSDLYLIEGLR
ncbi:MAG TPA: protein kinase [Vicinamibacteria bacterium]|nr:protein kinase [Vicinamibacteria bacterium]